MRIARIVVIGVGVFLLAWVLKEVLGNNADKKTEDLVQIIRLNGV